MALDLVPHLEQVTAVERGAPQSGQNLPSCVWAPQDGQVAACLRAMSRSLSQSMFWAF